MRNPIPPLFGIEKVHKRFSPLKRRSESAASSPHIKLSSVKFPSASEICHLRSQMLRTARWGWYLVRFVYLSFNSYAMSRCGLRKLLFRLKSAILMRYYTVNRTRLSAQLAYRQETWFKCYFYVYKKLCAKL